jgi:hypothetical protein
MIVLMNRKWPIEAFGLTVYLRLRIIVSVTIATMRIQDLSAQTQTLGPDMECPTQGPAADLSTEK